MKNMANFTVLSLSLSLGCFVFSQLNIKFSNVKECQQTKPNCPENNNNNNYKYICVSVLK